MCRHVGETPKEIVPHGLSVSVSPGIPGSPFFTPDHCTRSQAEIAKDLLI